MVKASKGNRQRSRKVLKKEVRERGSIPPLSKLMKQYEIGDKVVIDINSAIHKGMPHRRFQGRWGEVVGRKGKSFLIRTSDGAKYKVLYVRPEHLVPYGGTKSAN